MKQPFIVVRGDSLTLPRPERYEPPGLPLVTATRQTFPWLIGADLGAQVWNLSRRGMDADQFEEGVGLGLVEMVNSLEPDALITCFGYAEVWRRDTVEEVAALADRYCGTLNELAKRRPLMEVLIIGLPLAAPRIVERFPDINGRLSCFNQRLHASGHFVASSQELHSDGQHFSNVGHRELADSLLKRLRSVWRFQRARDG